MLFVVCCLLCAGCRLCAAVICGLLLAARSLKCVFIGTGCLSFVASCVLLLVVRCLWFAVRCLRLVVCCLLLVACCVLCCWWWLCVWLGVCRVRCSCSLFDVCYCSVFDVRCLLLFVVRCCPIFAVC